MLTRIKFNSTIKLYRKRFQCQGARAWAKASITKLPPTGLEYFYGF